MNNVMANGSDWDNETIEAYARENGNNAWLIYQYKFNKAINEPTYTIIIAMYSFLIVFGALGNTLVIISVIRKPAMRTPRNMFIMNLAIADFLLCTFTMPLTLMEIVKKYFPLGNREFLCKIISFMQATGPYVSTISITAIALDRYQVIVYPTKENLQLCGAVFILIVIWIVASCLAMPLVVVKHLESHNITLAQLEDSPGVDESFKIYFCVENWPILHGRTYYSIFTLVFHYTLPIIIISAAYTRISYKLRYRFEAGFVNGDEATSRSRRQLRERRLQRTNILLGSIAVIFFISWLPLDLYNLIADLYNFSFSSDSEKVIYAICHMMGMSSACLNPILYGCFNENFWKEFKDILCIQRRLSEGGGESQRMSLRKQSQRINGRGGGGGSGKGGGGRPDLVTAATDYQPCNTGSTDMTVLTRC